MQLRRYGLNKEATLQDDLVVPPDRLLQVSGREEIAGKGYVELKPTSIDDVKRWIGVPNAVARQRKLEVPRLESVSVPTDVSEVRNLKTDAIRSLHRLGELYVHGDSSLVSAYRQHIDTVLLHRAVIVGVFLRDIDVYGTLEIGLGVKVLAARTVRIWPSGRIKFLGDAKLDAVTVQLMPRLQLDPKILDELRRRIPPIGQLSSLEVLNA